MKSETSKKLTVWILQTGEPLHIDGGDQRPMRGMNLADSLIAAGHRVVWWSSAFDHQRKRHRSRTTERITLSDQLEIRLIATHGYEKNIGVARLSDHAQLAVNLKRLLRRESAYPDIAFVGYPPIETAAVMTRWLMKQGIPCVLDVKDQWPQLFLDAFPKGLRTIGRFLLWPYFHLARRAMKEATGVSTMAESFLDWSLAFSGRTRTRLDAVFALTSPGGQVTQSDLDKAGGWWSRQGCYDDGRARLMFVGSHGTAFDFAPLADAAKRSAIEDKAGHGPTEFVICGDGGSSTDLKSTMSGLPNVLFPGWVNRPQMEALAKRSLAALIPYRNTDDFKRSIPNKVIDALSLGLPILCPLEGEVANLIATFNVGLRYGAGTGKTLHDCVRVLIEDPDLQRRMSRNARALYEERFTFENVYGGMVKHLETMARVRQTHLDKRSLGDPPFPL